ncbi:ABC transporter ATP-binding protein [Singulisphaera sp. Ch08]|uniref:ABC transporter ATP-binding protein n=1 Tax=Singulisphaera sp. Ch08 TaxID=3120278 RepID=A0AAU7CLT4_9BACT
MIRRATAGPAIELMDLTKRYGASAVVDRLSLSVPRGSTFGLIGPNGAGKSTTIRMLMGMLAPTSGSARVLGIDVASRPNEVRRKVGYVPETHQIYRWMRVGEVIGFVRPFYDSWDDRLCEDLLDLFALDRNKRVKHLSKGTLAKLGLLLAVAHKPELLVLDEPVSGMDPIIREEFLEGVLRTVADGGRTILFSSHTLDDVRRLADSVGILCDGRLVVHRDVDALLASTKRVTAVLKDGCLPRRVPEGVVWQRVARREWSLTITDFSPEILGRLECENPIDSVTVSDLGLEEVFKDYIKGRRAVE